MAAAGQHHVFILYREAITSLVHSLQQGFARQPDFGQGIYGTQILKQCKSQPCPNYAGQPYRPVRWHRHSGLAIAHQSSQDHWLQLHTRVDNKLFAGHDEALVASNPALIFDQLPLSAKVHQFRASLVYLQHGYSRAVYVADRTAKHRLRLWAIRARVEVLASAGVWHIAHLSGQYDAANDSVV